MSQGFQPFQAQNRSKVAVVTGGNKGVGYSVVRKLLKKFRGVVYLTARNEEKGLAACEQLKREGLHAPKFYQLDITDRQQIMEFRQHLQKTYGGIDVLINNASVPHKSSSTEEHHDEEEEEEKGENAENGAPNAEENAETKQEAQHGGEQTIEVSININQESGGEKPAAEDKPAAEATGDGEKKKELTQEEEKAAEESRLLAESYKAHKKQSNPVEDFWVPKVVVDPRVELAERTMKTNVVGTVNAIHCLLPLFRPHGRIINISSSLGVLSSVTSVDLKEKFENVYLLESDLMDILKTYIVDVKQSTTEEKGWPKNVWVLSKLAINLMTRILARDHKYDERKDILITSCCPDLSEDLTPLTADQGAETPVYLALLNKANKNLHGKIFKDKKIMEWV